MRLKKISINGVIQSIIAEENINLAIFLRESLGLTSIKIGCGQGQCGSCSIILNGKVIRSCVYKIKHLKDFDSIVTLEGIGTPQNLHPLQVAWMAHGAAQCGYCSPGFIVSAKGLLDTNISPTREEVRDWFQTHRNACRCTGYKPLVDAVMAAAEVMRGEKSIDSLYFEIPKDGKLLGSKLPRPTALAKVTGQTKYGSDLILTLPKETLHIALVQAQVSHAKILDIDYSEAEKMSGVVRILTHKDVSGSNRINGMLGSSHCLCDGFDRPILCDEKVFQFGDVLALVCAESKEKAEAAAKKVKVSLELLPEYMSAPAAMADDAIEIHPGTPNIFFTQNVCKGEDTTATFESAPHTVSVETYVGRQPHMPIESDVGFAFIDAEGRLHMHTKTVAIFLHIDMVAEGIGVEREKFVLSQIPAGGVFGYKVSPTIEGYLGVAALATGRPVALNYSWYQQQTYTGKRSPFFVKARLAASDEGKILALESDWTVDHGAYSEFADNLAMRGAFCIGAGYDIPSIRGTGRTVFTNHAFGSACRGYGSPQTMFPSELLMDMLAEKVGIDPFEIRLRNIYKEGATTPIGQTPDVFTLPKILELGKPLYEESVKRCQNSADATIVKGCGISIGVFGTGEGEDTASAQAEIFEDGTVEITTTWQDHGQGADIGALTTAHESLRPLNILAEKIRLCINSSEKGVDGGMAAGSRSQVCVGNAIKVACENLLKTMQKPDGQYKSYAEMKAEGLETAIMGSWTAKCTGFDEETAQGSPFPTYMYALFISEVSVNKEDGKVSVDRIRCVADVGTIINKLAVDGQILGGLGMSIGLALSEDYEDIKKHSTMVGAGFPFIKQVPDDIEIIYIETPRKEGPFGASGVGELPNTSPHASIINAIYNACGVRITHLPARPAKVLAALAKKNAQRI